MNLFQYMEKTGQFRSWVVIMDKWGGFTPHRSTEPGQEIREIGKKGSAGRMYMRIECADNAAEAVSIAKDWAAQYYYWREIFKEDENERIHAGEHSRVLR